MGGLAQLLLVAEDLDLSILAIIRISQILTEPSVA